MHRRISMAATALSFSFITLANEMHQLTHNNVHVYIRMRNASCAYLARRRRAARTLRVNRSTRTRRPSIDKCKLEEEEEDGAKNQQLLNSPRQGRDENCVLFLVVEVRGERRRMGELIRPGACMSKISPSSSRSPSLPLHWARRQVSSSRLASRLSPASLPATAAAD